MKRLFLISFLSLSAMAPSHAQTKAIVNKETKSFSVIANIREDHKIFGYAAANVKSKKLILFSVFTNDVKANPHKCPLGAYYGTSDLPEGSDITFVSASPSFVKLTFITANHQVTPFYIQRKFVDFE